MDDSNPRGTDSDVERRREVGLEAAHEPDEFVGLATHFYRAELDRTTAWRTRLDQTTNWAVVVLAALLTWAFSSAENPHYVLLVGVVTVTVFLFVEAHRYRIYEVWRSRVRLLQENLFATAFDARGVEHEDWRRALGDDLRNPTMKITRHEALSRRLRRVYLPLLLVLLGAWVVRITAFAPADDWLRVASIEGIPGIAVVVGVAGFYASMVALAFWPMQRQATEEFREREEAIGKWKG